MFSLHCILAKELIGCQMVHGTGAYIAHLAIELCHNNGTQEPSRNAMTNNLLASLSKSFKNICCFPSKVLLISQFLLLCFPREKLNVARLAAHGFRKNSNQLQSCKKARKSHSSNIFFHGLGTYGER